MNWKRKLSSRKFWLALVGFITPLLTAVGMPDNEVTQVVKIIMSGSALIAYVLSEGYVDAKNVEAHSEDSSSSE